MVVNDQARARIHERLGDAGVRSDDPLVVIHVSAGNPFRRWPMPSFVELIVTLAERDPRRRFLVTSGPSEQAARQTVMNAARARLGPARADTIVDVGELDLSELHATLAHAALFVGPDSGPLHIASTTKVPIVDSTGPRFPFDRGPGAARCFPPSRSRSPTFPAAPATSGRASPATSVV